MTWRRSLSVVSFRRDMAVPRGGLAVIELINGSFKATKDVMGVSVSSLFTNGNMVHQQLLHLYQPSPTDWLFSTDYKHRTLCSRCHSGLTGGSAQEDLWRTGLWSHWASASCGFNIYKWPWLLLWRHSDQWSMGSDCSSLPWARMVRKRQLYFKLLSTCFSLRVNLLIWLITTAFTLWQLHQWCYCN